MRAAIYARFSTDRQSDTSAADQVRLCRERADREGWSVVDVFTDAAVSGSVRDRPQLQRLLARSAEFDVLLAESLDRISRDQEDIAGIHKRLAFAGVSIATLADGAVGEIHIGLKGTMAALFLKDLADKTRRGQVGRVEAGRIPGGLSYGYAKALRVDARGEPERGLRRIEEAQALVVRRIFAEYLAGESPRAIAQRLNDEGVPSPAGGLWRASTINGSRQRCNGILNNPLYAGRIVYNRQRFLRDPDTRRRVARPNPPELWRTQDVPELRIVDEATWAAAQARLARHAGQPLHKLRRPKRLLSGLMVCGECGAAVTIVGKDQWGCTGRKETGICGNNRLITTSALERRVLAALKDRLLSPALIEAYVSEYHAAAERETARRTTDRTALKKRLAEVNGRIANLAAAIAAGADVREIRTLLASASAERDAIEEQLAAIAAEAAVVRLHPRLADSYRQRIALLEAALDAGDRDRTEARPALRALIECVKVYPRHDARGVDLEIHGRLAQLIRLAQGTKKAPAEAGADYPVKLVAGARCRFGSALSIVRV